MEKLKQSGRALPWTPKQVEDRVLQGTPAGRRGLHRPDRNAPGTQERLPRSSSRASNCLRKRSSPAKTTRGKLIRLFLWHRSEDDPRVRIKSLNAQEPFSVYIKASLLVGVLLASPWIFYQIWHFVAAGLYPHERRYVHMYLPFSLGLFLAGRRWLSSWCSSRC